MHEQNLKQKTKKQTKTTFNKPIKWKKINKGVGKGSSLLIVGSGKVTN